MRESMDAKDFKELRELIDFLKENKIAEFELDKGETRVRIKFEPENAGPASAVDMAQLSRLMASAPAAVSAAPVAPSAAPADPDAGLKKVISPIVGTFYEAASPGSPPFVKIGDVVEVGQVLCIVEAMKLMNEIESDVAGEVVRMIAVNGQPVEYGQALYAIKPL